MGEVVNLKKRKKRKQKLNWTNNTPSSVVSLVSKEDVLYHIEIIKNIILGCHISENFLRFHILNAYQETSGHHSYLAYSTIKNRVLKRGHTDTDLWLYVNPLNYITKRDGRFTKVWYCAFQTENFVMDLDNVPNCKDIEDLLKILIKRDVPMPHVIVMTSESCFHLLYKGVTGDYSKNKRIEIGKRFAQINARVMDETVLRQQMKAAGVDYNYLVGNIHNFKIRIPGTINSKKSKNGNYVTTKAWYNLELITKKETQPKKIESAQIFKTIEDVVPTCRTYPRFISHQINFTLDELRLNFPEEDAQMFSEIFGSNWKFLKANEARIWQEYWAHAYGIDQTTVSRKIRKMIDLGYLIPTKEYERCIKARAYGPGPQLLSIMNKFVKSPSVYENYDITAPYIPGQFQDHIYADIRYLIEYCGQSEDRVVDFIMEKQGRRPKDKYRPRKVIVDYYRHWIGKLIASGRKLKIKSHLIEKIS